MNKKVLVIFGAIIIILVMLLVGWGFFGFFQKETRQSQESVVFDQPIRIVGQVESINASAKSFAMRRSGDVFTVKVQDGTEILVLEYPGNYDPTKGVEIKTKPGEFGDIQPGFLVYIDAKENIADKVIDNPQRIEIDKQFK